MATSPLQKLLLQQFEAHQRSEGKRSINVETRVAQINQKLEELALTNQVDKLSLDQNDDGIETTLHDELASILLHFIDCAMATDLSNDTKDSIESILELAAAVASSQAPVVVAEKILSRAETFSQVLLERVRATACRLIGFLVQHLMKHHPNAEALLDAASQALLPRFTDKSQSVRQAAIEAGQHFFVGNVDDPDIRQALLWSLQHDPSVSNREAALQSLPVNAQTMDYILARVRDTKTKVRVRALQVLQKVPMEDWNAEEMAALMEAGYTDRCKSTKDATSKLVCLAWMKAVRYDPIQLLQKMNVTLYEEACEKVLCILLNATDSTLSSLSAPEVRAFHEGIESASVEIKEATQEFQVESVFFSRVVCLEATKDSTKTPAQKEAVIGKIVSDIPVLCEVVERHTLLLMKAIDEDDSEVEDKLTCISLQLLQLASMADLEEGSRRHFSAVMKRMLTSILLPDDLVEGCVQALKSTSSREAGFMDTAAEIASELAKLEEENAEAGLEVNHLLRILSVLTIVLEHASPKMASNPVVAEFATHIVPGVTHSNTLVREAAVGCFGKLGLLTNEETVLSEFKPLLLQMASKQEEKAEIRAQAMLALSDWSMLFADVLQPCQVSGLSFGQLITDMMARSESALACIAAEVASKLLFSGKVCESQWLAQLIVVFFDRDDENEDEDEMDVKEVGSPVRLQQLLSVFFPAYSIKSKQGREALLGSISPLLDIFRQKINRKKRPRGSKTWPIVKMIEYVCSTVDVGKETAETAERDKEETKEAAVDEQIVEESTTALLSSIQIAKFLTQHSQDLGTTYLRALCKLLGGAELILEKEETKHCAILIEVMEELGMSITDNTCLRYLAKLNEVLSNVELDEEENEPIEDEDALAEAFEKVELSETSPVPDKENDLSTELEPESIEKGRESTASSVGSRRSLRSRSSN